MQESTDVESRVSGRAHPKSNHLNLPLVQLVPSAVTFLSESWPDGVPDKEAAEDVNRGWVKGQRGEGQRRRRNVPRETLPPAFQAVRRLLCSPWRNERAGWGQEVTGM